MILVHDDGNMRIGLHGCFDKVAQKSLASIFSRASRTLHDYRTVAFVRRLHDGMDLLQVIDVECGQAVAVFRCMVQKLTQ
jgi:hypothetical protein